MSGCCVFFFRAHGASRYKERPCLIVSFLLIGITAIAIAEEVAKRKYHIVAALLSVKVEDFSYRGREVEGVLINFFVSFAA